MTPTPRTDACKFYLAVGSNDLPTDAVCPAEKMAELEAENAEMREWILSAFFCIERGVGLMDLTELSWWGGVRGVMESVPRLSVFPERIRRELERNAGRNVGGVRGWGDPLVHPAG